MARPDWKDAPEWANYLAMDRSGFWYWHELKVHAISGAWMSDGHGRVERGSCYAPDWRETLEERPHA
jgi:hypothetical protein